MNNTTERNSVALTLKVTSDDGDITYFPTLTYDDESRNTVTVDKSTVVDVEAAQKKTSPSRATGNITITPLDWTLVRKVWIKCNDKKVATATSGALSWDFSAGDGVAAKDFGINVFVTLTKTNATPPAGSDWKVDDSGAWKLDPIVRIRRANYTLTASPT